MVRRTRHPDRRLRRNATNRHAVTAARRRLAPADGRLLWEIPFATAYEQNSVTPVIVKRSADLRRTQQTDDRGESHCRQASG